MIIGYQNNAPQKIAIRCSYNGYYLRWWYNGWHYWLFHPGILSLKTEGEKYRTIGTKSVMMGTGQITYEQCQAIRTILNTREVYILTDYGWRNIRIESETVQVYNNQINGYEIELKAVIGSRSISETGYSPVTPIPDIVYDKIYITHHNTGVFTMTLTGGGDIVIDWGDGTPPETYTLSDVPLIITHDYTGTTGDHVIIVDGEENIITLAADGQHITDIIIPPTATNLTDLDLPNNELTNTPEIPDSVPLVVLDLTGNPLTICEVTIGTQVWMCKNYDSNFPGSKVYNNDEANRAIYGGLYIFNQVVTNGFTPNAYKVPSEADWLELINYAGGYATAGGKLKEVGITHWNSPNTDATDDYNFSALGGGLYDSAGFDFLKEWGFFWTSTPNPGLPSDGMMAFCNKDSAWGANGTYPKTKFLSVRLLKKWRTRIAFSDWFLPSKGTLELYYTELHLYGLGNFTSAVYWSSSQSIDNPNVHAYAFNPTNNSNYANAKDTLNHVRACRLFYSVIEYNLRDVGPAGGYIFLKGTFGGSFYYLEVAPSDQSTGKAWSNIINASVAGTSVGVGTGQANTTAIIGQVGHTDSAAKLCDDLIITH